MARKIAFIGIDKFEYILYLSRIIKNLNKKVLLVDLSETQALASCIPVPINLKNKIVDYRGVYFNSGCSDINQNDFDIILIDYGFNTATNNDFDINSCDVIVYVTDMQQYTLRKIKIIETSESAVELLVIKNICKCKLKPRYVVDTLNIKNLIKENIFMIYMDFLDIKSLIECQYDEIFTFKNLSQPVKSFLICICKLCIEDGSDSTIINAFNKAKKGE